METLLMQDQKEFKYKEGDTTTLRDFDNLYKELYKRDWEVNGKTYNLAKLGWTREYNNRKRALGNVQFSRVGNKTRRIFISKTQLSLNLDKAVDFEDTIRHEFAHAIDVEIRGYSNHDSHWQMVARALGSDDSRLHEGFLSKPKGKYSAKCGGCGKTHEAYRAKKRTVWCKCRGRAFKPEEALVFTQNY